MQIAVLITVHNRKNTTLECLKYLYKNIIDGYGMSVYLVDDGSTDGTTDAVKLEFPQVCIIRGDGNLFWCRGMVEAWRRAVKDNPDYYLWLNDDTMLFENAIHVIISAYSSVEKKSIISGAIVASDQKTVSYGGKKGDILVYPNEQVQELDKVNGNFVLVPKIIYETFGMLDPHFHHAYGDWEYGIRVKKGGAKVYLTPSFVGVCERHDKLPKCYNSDFNIIERFKHLYSPLGPCPPSAFYYDVRCRSFSKAILNFSYMNFRCALPYLWSKSKF